MKIADGELRQLLTYDVKMPAQTVRELVADSKQTGRTLLQTVLASKAVKESQLAKAQAKRLGVPFIDLGQAAIPQKTLQQLPRQIAAKYRVICFDQTPTSIKLAMADPRDEAARKAVKDYSHKTVRRYQATTDDLTKAMRGYTITPTPLHYSTQDLLSTVLEQALHDNVRDIHFVLQKDELLIQHRIGKRLQTVSTLPSSKLRSLISWCKLRSGNDVGDTERPHHGQFAIKLNGSVHNVMMSSVPAVAGEKLVLRLIPSTHSIPSLSVLGYGAKEVDAFEQYLTDGRGLILIAGDKTSGISTTLASLTKRAARATHTLVASVEDPLLYTVADCTQVEVTSALPFAEAVSSVISQNPNILVTSHLGKRQSIEELVDFSLSQHLVISRLMASNLAAVFKHLRNYPIAPALLAASLRLIVVQHQIAVLCTACRVEFNPTGPLKKALQDQFGFADNVVLYRKGPGCNSCNNGHKGTVLAWEWLAVNHELQQLLATSADAQTLEQYAARHNTLARQLRRLASKGIISIDEATQRVA